MNHIHDKPLQTFKFKELGQMAIIGHLTGVAEVFGIRFSGLLAFLFWRMVYLMKLPGIYCKCRVFFDWVMDLFFPIDITQLDVFH